MDNMKLLIVVLVLLALSAVVYYVYFRGPVLKADIPAVFVEKLRGIFPKDKFPNLTESDLINIANARYKKTTCDENNISSSNAGCDLTNLPWWCLENVRSYSDIARNNCDCSSADKKAPCDSLCNDKSDYCHIDLTTLTPEKQKEYIQKRLLPETGGSGLGQWGDKVLCSKIFPNKLTTADTGYTWHYTRGNTDNTVSGPNFKKNMLEALNNCPWNKGTKRIDFTQKI